MSEIPPAHGEEHGTIHLPGPSWWPILAAIGVAMLLSGLVISIVMVIVGALLAVSSIGLWIRAARREFRALPE
jgi:hypothetical protein